MPPRSHGGQILIRSEDISVSGIFISHACFSRLSFMQPATKRPPLPNFVGNLDLYSMSMPFLINISQLGTPFRPSTNDYSHLSWTPWKKCPSTLPLILRNGNHHIRSLRASCHPLHRQIPFPKALASPPSQPLLRVIVAYSLHRGRLR